MAKITTVEKARKDQGTCESCGQPIVAGTSYRYVKLRPSPTSSVTRKRHASCPRWKASELTGSAAKAAVLGALEMAEEELGRLQTEDPGEASDVEDVVHQVAEGYREAAEYRRESAENIREGFGHDTSQSEELDSEADELDAAADELEGWEVDATRPDEPPADEDIKEGEEDEAEAAADELETWWQDALSEAQDFLGEVFQL